jgi:hypothetical protein
VELHSPGETILGRNNSKNGKESNIARILEGLRQFSEERTDFSKWSGTTDIPLVKNEIGPHTVCKHSLKMG